MNLRILIYLNPSNIDKVTHKFKLEQDSGFINVKNSILFLNKICTFHFYVLVPYLDCWVDKPDNVTLVKYPYINDALNSRFHFDTNALNNYFNNYKHDIDLIWTMLPEHAGALKAFANKRREEIPIFSYINWMDYKENKGYFPSYILRMFEGISESDAVGIQSVYMYGELFKLFKKHKYNIKPNDIHKLCIIYPKTDCLDYNYYIGDVIGFPHRVSIESGFKEMYSLIKDHLKYKLWVTNINNSPIKSNDHIISKTYNNREEYINNLKKIRFGISYHINYSMWSMSVLDMMGCGKVVLVPYKNAFMEMMPQDYPFFFKDKQEFINKFIELQECDDTSLMYWGNKCREKVKNNYTWYKQAFELNEKFIELVTKHKITDSITYNAVNVFKSILKFNAITKSDLINKNITRFSRRCSRSWNKTRIELMRNFKVKDDVTKEHTVFYIDENRYKSNGIEKRPEKKLTKYELKKICSQNKSVH